MKAIPPLLFGLAFLGIVVWSTIDDERETHAQTIALQQIAESLKHPPAAPESEDCHVALSLFDEMLRHQLKNERK